MGCKVNKAEVRFTKSNSDNSKVQSKMITNKRLGETNLIKNIQKKNLLIKTSNHFSLDDSSCFYSEKDSEFECNSNRNDLFEQYYQIIEGNGPDLANNENSENNFSDLRNTNYYICTDKENLKSISFKINDNRDSKQK